MKKEEKKSGYGKPKKGKSRPSRTTMRVGGSRGASRSTSSKSRRLAPPTRGGRGGR